MAAAAMAEVTRPVAATVAAAVAPPPYRRLSALAAAAASRGQLLAADMAVEVAAGGTELG
eukprot:scaffold47140_cov18-Phaeocystis_antarctica.AAC.1